ncbi:FeoB small GTPase domain-containing protein [Paenibacillus sp. HB172176]|uniref:FeoB small GTPase domain-containing protein n=1 Tax=Paenibacillus sp. HB172176 TaxID=2493690 RepID=UPI00143A36AA|nr:FeoB small GTPase domain-containing protein [Paenibacillus sp. HB172176]
MAHYRIALAGNPNTGKSTLFNSLTGMRQHTGNWAGKTVARAEGSYDFDGNAYTLIDLPGTYSLFTNSADEEVARDYIIFDKPDVTVVVLDATSLERNMNLALQVMEMTPKVVLCINLIDEARKLGISIDAGKLASKLGVPVLKISARKKEGIQELLKVIQEIAIGELLPSPMQITYNDEIESRIKAIEPEIKRLIGDQYPSRWVAVRLIEGDDSIWTAMESKAMSERTKEWIIHEPANIRA